jgi:hypothetical protein
MEIKKRLNAAAKRLTPEIESMNCATEMHQLADRLDGLLDYAEQKIEQRKHTTKDGKTASQRTYEGLQDDRRNVQAIHSEEADAALADQVQADAQPDVEHVVTDEEALATLESS